MFTFWYLEPIVITLVLSLAGARKGRRKRNQARVTRVGSEREEKSAPLPRALSLAQSPFSLSLSNACHVGYLVLFSYNSFETAALLAFQMVSQIHCTTDARCTTRHATPPLKLSRLACSSAWKSLNNARKWRQRE